MVKGKGTTRAGKKAVHSWGRQRGEAEAAIASVF